MHTLLTWYEPFVRVHCKTRDWLKRSESFSSSSLKPDVGRFAENCAEVERVII